MSSKIIDALNDASMAIALAKAVATQGGTPNPPPEPKGNHRVGIFVGHSRTGDNGAVSIGGVSEWDFNNKVATALSQQLSRHGISNFICNNYEGSGYTTAMKWVGQETRRKQATIAIELHFNAASSPAAHGYEYLHYDSSGEGKKLATAFHDAHKDYNPDQRSRGLKPVEGKDRGAGFLKNTPCPAIICEPFFGSNVGEWQQWDGKEDEVAEIYMLGVSGYIES